MLWWTLRQLSADDWRARETAAKKLGELRDARSIGPLFATLKDKNSHVRHAAEGALVKIGTPAIKTLIAALQDRDSETRNAAQGVLIQIGSPAVLPLGLALADGDLEAREIAAATLGKIGDETALEQLVAALKYGDSGAKEAAAAGLVRIGRSAVVPLVGALKETKLRVRETAAAALVRIGRPAIDSLVLALKDREVREAALEALRRIDRRWAKAGLATAVLPEFVRTLKDGDEKTREAAARVLGEIGDPAAVDPLADALSDQNEGVREAAAMALGEIGDSRAIPALVMALGTRNTKSFKTLVEALVQIGHATVEPLVSALKDRQPWVREGAASALVRVGNSIIDPLIEAVSKMNSDWAKSEAARDAIPRFVATLKQGATHMPRETGEAVKKTTEVRIVKPLVTVSKAKPTADTKAASPTSKVSDESDVITLSLALQSPDPNTRASAAGNLRQICNSNDDPLTAALKHRSQAVRRAAAHALAASSDARGRDVLRADLRDSSTLIVLDAAESLAKIEDASAFEPLMKILASAGEPPPEGPVVSVHETWRAFQLLLSLIEGHASELTVEELRRALDLHHEEELAFVASADAKMNRDQSGDDTGGSSETSQPAYSRIRELARRELNRRNVKV